MDARIRRTWKDGDAEAVVALHERIYPAEHGVDERFVADVRRGVWEALARGFPGPREGVRVVESGGRVAGSAARTDEGSGTARLRWVLLDPRLRGRGLGRRIVTELVADARALGFARVELDTFAALEAAGRIYRELGFEQVSERVTRMWGPPIRYRHYELRLDPGASRGGEPPLR